jgi:hypothetical protein
VRHDSNITSTCFRQGKTGAGFMSSRVRKNSQFVARARSVTALLFFGAAVLALLMMAAVDRACAAASAGCTGGGFTFLGLSGNQRGSVPAGSVPGSFLVKGKYVEFTVDAATFDVRDWTLTGAPNPLDITGGRRTVVFCEQNTQQILLRRQMQRSGR